jgi:N utilization substance protein B
MVVISQEPDQETEEEGLGCKGFPPRRRARTAALLALCEVDLARHNPLHALEWIGKAVGLSQEGLAFAQSLLLGTLGRLQEIDTTIHRCAPAWPVPQLATVDRNILRLAIYELTAGLDTPPKVVVNEAVELAKHYGGDTSPRFVNGVLGCVMEMISPSGDAPHKPQT